MIDDVLNAAAMAHEKEPPYPSGGFRADFRVGGTLIEYLGLSGDSAYDAKTRRKRAVCEGAGVRLLEIYPDDLASRGTLMAKLRSAGILDPIPTR